MEFDINKFLNPDKKLFWFKVWLATALVVKRQIVILFPVNGLDVFPADPSMHIFKQASSQFYNDTRQALSKHFLFKEFYFDSRDLPNDDPRFISHCESLDEKSRQAFEVRKKHPWFRDSYIVTLGFKCIITKIKFFA